MNYYLVAMITIYVTQKIPAPVEKVSRVLLEHQKLDRFFNANISLKKPENNGEISGGKGAIRQIMIGKIVFFEEIISATTQHICYRIIGKGPVSEHQGDIRLTPVDADDKASQLDYVITFKSPRWLPSFVLKWLVERDIKKAMWKLAQYFLTQNSITNRSVEGTSL